jgi:hypothetical protein
MAKNTSNNRLIFELIRIYKDGKKGVYFWNRIDILERLYSKTTTRIRRERKRGIN